VDEAGVAVLDELDGIAASVVADVIAGVVEPLCGT
jgi:hypothetical protein